LTNDGDKDRDSDRKDFMLHMYSAFWDCISRAEDSAWKIIAAYVALFVGISYLYQILGPAGVATVFIIFSFAAVALALRANTWFLRNLGLISNLEKEFLKKIDYGTLVPGSFAEHKELKFFNREIWIAQAVAFLGICVAFLFFVFPKIAIFEERIVVSVVFAISVVLTAVYGWYHYSEFRRFMQGAPGKNVN